MKISADIPDAKDYAVCTANGQPIFGLKSFDTETGEGEMMVIDHAQQLTEIMADGTKKHHVKGTGISVKKVKIEGAYATYKGQRIE